MGISDTLALIALGAVLGAAGQGVRAVVGVKKALEAAQGSSRAGWFDGRRLGYSLLLGAVAGVVAAVAQYQPGIVVTRSLLLGFAAAGYAGADFVSGAFGRWLPKA